MLIGDVITIFNKGVLESDPNLICFKDEIEKTEKNIGLIKGNSDGTFYYKPNYNNSIISFSKVNFTLNKHIEIKKQIKNFKYEPAVVNKFKVDFIYNFKSKYEDYLNLNKNLDEIKLININSLISRKLRSLLHISVSDVLTNLNNIKEYTIDTNNLIPYYGKYYYTNTFYIAKNLRDKNIPPARSKFSTEKLFLQVNENKDLFPFYVKIYFDNIKIKNYNDSLTKIFENSDEILFIIQQSILKNQKTIQFPFLETFLGKNLEKIYLYNNFCIKNKNYFKDIFNGKTYSEVIGYKIVKYDSKDKILQEWYFTNNSKDYTEFIDTQIHFQKIYKYKIFYFVAYFQSSLEYTIPELEKLKPVTNPNTPQINSNLNTSPDLLNGSPSLLGGFFPSKNLSMQYSYYNNLMLTEIPGPEYTNQIGSSPPLVPQVEFIPYINIDNKVKINLSTLLGRTEEEPRYIVQKEETIINNIKKQQDREDNNKIIYESDDINKSYEIYKLYSVPKNYDDFLNAEKIIVDSKYSSISYIDNITPNKKIYYCFRAIDNYDQFSNFSDIYIFEIIKDEISLYTKLEIKKINEIRENINLEKESRKFKKYLYISPSIPHLLFDSENDEEFNNLTNKNEVLEKAKIGILSPSVWDKKFKIRLTSLSSGKKIDLNVIYTIKRNYK